LLRRNRARLTAAIGARAAERNLGSGPCPNREHGVARKIKRTRQPREDVVATSDFPLALVARDRARSGERDESELFFAAFVSSFLSGSQVLDAEGQVAPACGCRVDVLPVPVAKQKLVHTSAPSSSSSRGI